jgi:hypothetical protein
MNEFDKLRKRLSLIKVDERSDGRFIKEIKNTKSLIDSQEKYYNSIMLSIRTSNTLANITERLLKNVIYLENYERKKTYVAEAMYVNERNLKEEAENDNVITVAYLEQSQGNLADREAELIQRVNALATKETELVAKEQELEAEKINCVKLTDILDSQIKKCNGDKVVLNEEINLGKENYARVDEELLKQQLKLIDSEKRLQICKSVLDALKIQLKIKEDELITLQKELEMQKMEYSKLTDLLNTKINELTEENIALNQEITNLKSKITESEQSLQLEKNNVIEKGKELEMQKVECSKLTDLLNTKTNELTEENTVLNQEITNLKSKITESEQSLQLEKNNVIEKGKELEMRKVEYSKLTDLLNTKKNELTEATTVLNQEITNLKSKITESEKIISKESELEKTIASLRENVITREKELEDLKNEMDLKDKLRSILQDEINRCRNSENILQGKINDVEIQKNKEIQKLKQPIKIIPDYIKENIDSISPTDVTIRTKINEYIIRFNDLTAVGYYPINSKEQLEELRKDINNSIKRWDSGVAKNTNRFSPDTVNGARALLLQVNEKLNITGSGPNKSDLSDDLCIIQ